MPENHALPSNDEVDSALILRRDLYDPEELTATLETLRRLVLPWPDEMRCFPGHGPAFHLGEIRPAIERFLAADHSDFFGDATWDM